MWSCWGCRPTSSTSTSRASPSCSTGAVRSRPARARRGRRSRARTAGSTGRRASRIPTATTRVRRPGRRSRTGPGQDAVTQYIDVEDPIIGISAERVQLVISDFFTVRGSFSFVQGGLETVTVETSLPAASEAAFASAVGGVTGLTYDDGTITGIGVTTTLIGIGNAAVFAGYNPDGFTIGDDFTCSELETADKAIGLCADGIEVGIALASLTDPDLIPGYALPNFVAAKVTVEDIELLGLPTEFFDLDFAGIAVVLNRGGQVATRTGVARTPITGSNSWIDWEASFPDPDGGDTGTPAGLPVETGAGHHAVHRPRRPDHRRLRRPGHAEDLRLRLHHGRLRVRAGQPRGARHRHVRPDGPRADEPRRGARRRRLDGRRRQDHRLDGADDHDRHLGRVGVRGLQPGRLRGRGRQVHRRVQQRLRPARDRDQRRHGDGERRPHDGHRRVPPAGLLRPPSRDRLRHLPRPADSTSSTSRSRRSSCATTAAAASPARSTGRRTSTGPPPPVRPTASRSRPARRPTRSSSPTRMPSSASRPRRSSSRSATSSTSPAASRSSRARTSCSTCRRSASRRRS